MKHLILTALIAILAVMGSVPAPSWGTQIQISAPAPVLNSASVARILAEQGVSAVPTDDCGQIHQLEFIAAPGTVFTITGEPPDSQGLVYTVTTTAYQAPPGITLYLPRPYAEPCSSPCVQPSAPLLPRPQILAFLELSVGAPYVWGGNQLEGIANTPDLEHEERGCGEPSKEPRFLVGLDCSGLLYQATRGYTPRNTRDLVQYGSGLNIAGKNVNAIAGMLQPLDLIVWDGHVIVVLDRNQVVESKLECRAKNHGGVVVTPLRKRLKQIMEHRSPANSWAETTGGKDRFVVRRWYGL